jgi:nicotinate-nucleotide adenylyltransferase
VSSTNIKARWREGKTIRYMVPKEVWEYINENELY